MPDVVAQGAEGVLGLHFDDDDLLSKLACAARHGGAGVPGAADDDALVSSFPLRETTQLKPRMTSEKITGAPNFTATLAI